LTPFTKEEFASFYEDFIPEYADAMLKAHMFQNEEEAARFAKTQMEHLFPGKTIPSGHHLLKIQSDESDVGYLWYADKRNSSSDAAWLCYIYVDPAFRNRGYATAAIAQMELNLKALGVSQVGMSVFSANPTLKLYESLGYSIVQTFLTPDSKEILRYELFKTL
jgi:ribosomal protein S18 acetylase RimI-like enzyme